jgi:putative membrane protein
MPLRRPLGVQRELAGSIAGFLATAPMTIGMMAMHRMLPPEHKDPLPPRQITDNAAARAGIDLGDEDTRNAAALGAHFTYGASVGAMYGPMAGSTSLPSSVEGMLYGIAVWGGSYLGILPGAGLYRSADDESAPRNAMIIAAHLIWGASLGVMTEALADKS